jgi:hypothetical protein
MEETTKTLIVEHREQSKLQDSIEIGTPAKGGALKIYCDFADVEGTKEKINNAILLKEYANDKVGN